MHILLVEDDEMLGKALTRALSNRKDEVRWVKDGEQALYASEEAAFDCVILDVNIPKLSGMEVIKHLRQVNKNNVPVLMLTAMDSLEYRVRGLNSGADDYLTKPFELEELYARIKAMVRRYKSADVVLRAGDVELDLAAKTLKKNGETIFVSSKELKLLTLLMERKGKISSKSQIEETLYDWEEEIDSNTIEVTIYNLRKKLGKDFIHNIRNIGYVIK